MCADSYGVRLPPIFMFILIQHVSVIEVKFDIEHIKFNILLKFNFPAIQHISVIIVNQNIGHIKFGMPYTN